MAGSVTNLDLISVSQAQKEVTANSLFDAASSATVFGRRASTTSALTWGVYGGAFTKGDGTIVQLANTTITLAPSVTNYLEADTNGVVTVNSTAFTPGLLPLYSVITGTSTVTSYLDQRTGAQGNFQVSSLPNGSVTTVSVVTANGISGTVATATTTPAITLTLGAIVPTSVAATGTVTGSNLSGTNTGDQVWITPVIASTTATTSTANINVAGVDIVRLNLQASVTTFTISGGVDGQRFILEVLQDTTGGRTLTWPSNVRGSETVPLPTISTAVNALDRIGFIYHGPSGKYDCTAAVKNYA
jgi:hypothetical protein